MWKYLGLIFLLSSCAVAQEKTDYAAELTKAQQALTHQEYAAAYIEFFRVAKISKNPLAQFNLALFNQYGWGRPVDEAMACGWYAKAAAGNIPVAQHFYADCLRNGIAGDVAPTKAADWYRRAADNGYIISLCSLAELYIEGVGVSQDRQRGLALCQQAANTGLSKAMIRMARFHLSTDPAIKNERRALDYLQQAAQLHNMDAQFMLAVFYRDGAVGHHANYNLARKWFELAAAHGYIPAYYQVGVLYFNAPIDPATNALPAPDLAKAYLWLSAAAQRSQQASELRKSEHLLAEIAKVMPKAWLANLNKKLNEHLRLYPFNADTKLASKQ